MDTVTTNQTMREAVIAQFEKDSDEIVARHSKALEHRRTLRLPASTWPRQFRSRLRQLERDLDTLVGNYPDRSIPAGVKLMDLIRIEHRKTAAFRDQFRKHSNTTLR
jgi:hypothetical protein